MLGNLTVFHFSFHQLENSFLKSLPSFSAKPPPIHQTLAKTKRYSRALTSYLSRMDSRSLHMEITMAISMVGMRYLKDFLTWMKVSGRYFSKN